MFASSTFVLAAISVLARVAVATPPACLIGAVGAQTNPADMKTLCGSGAVAVEGNITSLCTGDASSQAMSIFSSSCLAAGVTISVSSSTASSSDSSTTGSDSATTGSTSATGTSKSTGFATATATGSSASKTSSHTGSKGSSSTSSAGSSTASSSSATGTVNSAGFSTSPEHALYLSPIFLGALAYFL